jgi:hypothetical protein
MLRSPPFLLGFGFGLSALLPLVIPIARNLEYEYATLVAYASLFILPAVSLVARRDRRTSLWMWILTGSLIPLVLIAPALIAYRTGLCLCAERDFYFWSLIQTFPHLILASACFGIGLRLRQAGVARRFCVYMGLLVFFLLFLHLGWSLWMNPQKRTTHLLAGFIHGAIYDNWIPVDAGILWTRATHAWIACSLLASAVLWTRKRYLVLSLLPLLGAYETAKRAAPFPSQALGLDALMSLMPEKRKEDRFTLHHKAFESADERWMLDEIFAAAQFHVHDLAEQLQVYDTHVHIFVYPSREAKKLWFGGDGTDITDVVTPSIHINLEAWPHGTLRHELVHALTSSFAFRGLGFHPNLAFTEGLAVALAPHEEEMSLHAGAANLVSSGRLPDLRGLFSPLFWRESGRRAYTVAGSILKFLIDHYGVGRVKQLYAGDSWQSVFDTEADRILADWRNFLEAQYPPTATSIKAEALFRYPGILEDRCPHSKALLAKSGDDALLRFRQPQNWVAERDYWPWRMRLESDPSVRLAYLRSQVQALWANFDREKAIRLAQEILSVQHRPPKTIEDVELFLLHNDILVGMDQLEEAKTALMAFRQILEGYDIGDHLVRQIWARTLLMQEPAERAGPWLKLLTGIRSEVPSWSRQDRSWIIRYLYLRNHRFTGQQQPLLEFFAKLEPPKELPQTFAVEWYRSLGMQWMQRSYFREAGDAFLAAASLAPEGKREALTLYAIEAQKRGENSRTHE